MEYLGSIILALVFWFVAWLHGKRCHAEGVREGFRQRDDMFK